jgi:lipoprotein-anchoring transpeptidase ErfK/SrfK
MPRKATADSPPPMPAVRPARHTHALTARGRIAAVLTALSALGIAVAATALWSGARPELGATAAGSPQATAAGDVTGRAAAASWTALDQSAAQRATAATTRKPMLSRACPRSASACVDLDNRLTWLQSDGAISFGPVRMEPGPAGTSEATPRGIFHVAWKAGASYMSTEFGEPIPYAVFFAPGGIAFHGGSLTKPSHGCVHLGIRNARYYHHHLPLGAEVAVF